MLPTLVMESKKISLLNTILMPLFVNKLIAAMLLKQLGSLIAQFRPRRSFASCNTAGRSGTEDAMMLQKILAMVKCFSAILWLSLDGFV